MCFFRKRKKRELEQQRIIDELTAKLESQNVVQDESSIKMEQSMKLRQMKRDSAKFQSTINEYANKARMAFEKGVKSDYQIQRQLLNNAMKRKQVLDIMVAQLENSIHNEKLNNVVADFINISNEITEKLKSTNSDVSIEKIFSEFENSLGLQAEGNDYLNEFLQTANASYQDFSGHINDDDLDVLIFPGEKTSNKEFTDLDKEIAKLRKELE